MDLVEIVDRISSETGEPALENALVEGEAAVDIANTMILEADKAELPGLYEDLQSQLTSIGSSLSDYGAGECADLGEALP
jgi:hypothetical protein